MNIGDIKSVFVHWSESEYINRTLCCNDDGDIDKPVDKFAFDSIIKEAAPLVGLGYDKTVLSIAMENGEIHEEIKFNLTSKKDSLIKLIDDL